MKKLFRKLFFKEFDSELLIGSWYGIREMRDSSRVMTCSTYHDDGGAEVHFKQKFNAGNPYEALEEGQWTLAKNKLTKTLQDQYGRTATNVYRVTRLTKNRFDYISESTKVAYSMKKSNPAMAERWDSFLPPNDNVPRPPKPRSRTKPDFPNLNATVDFSNPVLMTEAFIEDYEAWNAFAYRINRENVILEFAREAYSNLLRKYCSYDTVGQDIAFGNRSMHRSKFELVVSSIISENTAIVSSVHKKDLAGLTVEDNFEYNYVNTGDGWRLRSLVIVLEDERVECLNRSHFTRHLSAIQNGNKRGSDNERQEIHGRV